MDLADLTVLQALIDTIKKDTPEARTTRRIEAAYNDLKGDLRDWTPENLSERLKKWAKGEN